eukprot:m.126290 g.126290  ORF g.126290 m.126290 type:complete len:205 (+) comp12991_c0_seq5:2175-2789(+)
MIWPREVHYYAQRSSLNLIPGRYRVKLQWYKNDGSNECLAGWEDGTTANSIAIEEKHPGRIAIVPSRLNNGNTRYNLGDYRNKVYRSYRNVPNRVVNHVKKSSNSIIKVTYMDTIGWYTTSSNHGCIFRLLVDGSTSGTREMWNHGSTVGGWRIHAHTYTFYPTVGTGGHTYVIQSFRDVGASECLNGWSASNNFLMVEEVFNN